VLLAVAQLESHCCGSGCGSFCVEFVLFVAFTLENIFTCRQRAPSVSISASTNCCNSNNGNHNNNNTNNRYSDIQKNKTRVPFSRWTWDSGTQPVSSSARFWLGNLYLYVCVCLVSRPKVSLSVKAKQVDSVSDSDTTSDQDLPTILEMKKMWFRLRFFTVFLPVLRLPIHSPIHPQPNGTPPPKAQSLFVLLCSCCCCSCCWYFFSFYGNSRKVFVGILFI